LEGSCPVPPNEFYTTHSGKKHTNSREKRSDDAQRETTTHSENILRRTMAESQTESQAKGRQSNMSDSELRQLCLSYLAITQDPVVGVYQRRESYWTRIESHYNERRPSTSPVRSLKSLQDKFGKI
jgi:hypothetical protein